MVWQLSLVFLLASAASINSSQEIHVLLLELNELEVQAILLSELCEAIFKSRSALR